jgi:hypothetical protein
MQTHKQIAPKSVEVKVPASKTLPVQLRKSPLERKIAPRNLSHTVPPLGN